MKRTRTPWRIIVLAALAIFVMAGACAYLGRGAIREAYRQYTTSTLPQEEAYEFIRVPREQPTEEPAEPDNLPPADKRLAVPFTSQAPHANWDMPYQEACEEASILMVAAYYAGESGVITPNDADERIVDLVAFEEEELGLKPDITAAQAATVIEVRYPHLKAEVRPLEGAEQIKRLIAEGIPVIIPADGKALPNPNFRNGGPRYHMLVVRGYTPSHFITNDPGTRLGENFRYTYRGLLDAVHDWNGGDVPNGEQVILVVTPRE